MKGELPTMSKLNKVFMSKSDVGCCYSLSGNIRVYCRIRPFLPGQISKHTTVDFVGENGDLIIHNPLKPQAKDGNKVFSFNKIFGPAVTQGDTNLLF